MSTNEQSAAYHVLQYFYQKQIYLYLGISVFCLMLILGNTKGTDKSQVHFIPEKKSVSTEVVAKEVSFHSSSLKQGN